MEVKKHLKPCPHCGDRGAELVCEHTGLVKRYRVETACPCGHWKRSESEAIEAWNYRYIENDLHIMRSTILRLAEYFDNATPKQFAYDKQKMAEDIGRIIMDINKRAWEQRMQ